MEGAEAMEEGRGHEFLITWERVGNEGDQAMEEGRGRGTIFLEHRNFNTSEFRKNRRHEQYIRILLTSESKNRWAGLRYIKNLGVKVTTTGG